MKISLKRSIIISSVSALLLAGVATPALAAPVKNIVLVHAARFAADLSYLPLMQQLQQRYNGKLHIQTVVSREQTPGSLSGRVPALIADGSLENAVGLKMDASDSHIMLCGNPQMVRDTQLILKESRDMRKHLRRKPGHMTSEHYW